MSKFNLELVILLSQLSPTHTKVGGNVNNLLY